MSRQAPNNLFNDPTADPMRSWATFSRCLRYRYALGRVWDSSLPIALFIGLNPSKAGAEENDNTIRKEMGFARRWACGGILKGNLYGYISTDPRTLKNISDPIGPENNAALEKMKPRADLVVFAWGADPAVGKLTAMEMMNRFPGAKCLGKTKDGHPRHTLYLPYETPLVDF